MHVVSLNGAALTGYDGVRVHTLWRPRWRNALPERVLKTPVVLARLRRLLRAIAPDVVHAHSASGYAWVTWLSGARPYVVTPWGTDVIELPAYR